MSLPIIGQLWSKAGGLRAGDVTCPCCILFKTN